MALCMAIHIHTTAIKVCLPSLTADHDNTLPLILKNSNNLKNSSLFLDALSFKDLWFPLFIRLEKRCPVKQCPKRKQQKKKESATHSSKSTSDPPTSTNDTPNSTPALLSSGPETHPTSVERVPSKRGEHIINQDVLKVERKIFQEFLGKLWVDKR